MKIEELKEEIKLFERLDDTFEHDGVIYYKSKGYVEILKSQLKTLQECNKQKDLFVEKLKDGLLGLADPQIQEEIIDKLNKEVFGNE